MSVGRSGSGGPSDPEEPFARDATLTAEGAGLAVDTALVRRFRLTQLEGADRGKAWESTSDRCGVGAHPSNDLVVDDPTVSRFHCEIRMDARGALVKDVGSHNGTILDGVTVVEAVVREGSVLRLGQVSLRFDVVAQQNRLPVSEKTSFGALVSSSVAMRQTFAVLDRAAASDANVLLEGETGTGKSVAAREIHEKSARREGPFLIVDCGAMPTQLLDSELFGHEKGAFTGATSRRVGAFEEATGGTVLLDEISELAPELQPKLLRVIEDRVIRRIGLNTATPVDVRIIAASNRDLRAEVNAGRFRSDLYFRAAVLRIHMPSLRQRPEDIPLLVDRMLASLGAGEQAASALRAADFLAALRRAAWPGNVRELRNHIERCLVLDEPLRPTEGDAPASAPAVDPNVAYAEARQRAIDAFERAYVAALLEAHQGKITRAAGAAGMDRAYLHRLIRRHRLG